MTAAPLALLALSACGEPPPRIRGMPDAGMGGTPVDAAVGPSVDAARIRMDLGPLPPDPMVEAIDRTRAASCPAASRWVVAVRGRVIDEDGAPIQGVYVQSCILLGGSDRRVCLRPSMSDAAGVVTAIFPEESRCVDEVALRMLVPDSTLATGYCAVAEAAVDAVLVPSRPLVLVDTDAPSAHPPAGDPMTMRAVDFPGVTLMATPNAIGVENYGEMGARVLPGALATDTCLGDGTPMDMLVAFTPEATIESPAGYPARIAAQGIAPGERVELLIMGGLATTLASGELVPEAEWHAFGTATVGDDGMIATPTGAGVPHLGWLGIRRAR